MSRPPSTWSDAELEAALRDVGQALEEVPAPNLAAAVADRIRAAGWPAPASVRGWRGWPGGRLAFGWWTGRPLARGLVVALVLLLVIAGIAAAVGLGLPGLRLVFTEPPSAAPSAGPLRSAEASATPGRTQTAIQALDLGSPIAASQIDAAAGFHVLVPSSDLIGPPGAAFVDTAEGRDQASLVYAAPAGGLAASGAPAVLVTAFPGRLDAGYLQKVIEPGTEVTPVTVAAAPGFWISGTPHQLLVVGSSGSIESDRIRIVGNVLAWTVDGLTVRIEGARDLGTALRIAGSMH